MKSLKKTLRATAATTGLVLLTACGGGGGGSSGGALFPIGGAPSNQPPADQPPSNPPQSPAASVSGVAATGAPFAGANIVVVDQTGATVCTTQTDAAGAYNCPSLPAGTKVPLVITAQRDDQTLYSATASTTGGTVNVTPLTTIIVSRLSPNGNPAGLAGAIQTNPDSLSATSIQQQVTALVTALQPLLSTLGQGALDPISGVFVADGTGPDKVLDAISVSVRPDGTAANIEITVKTVPTTDGSAPVAITFRSSDSALPALPPITASDLAQIPSPTAVAALFNQITACFALPLSQRVDTAPNDTSAAVGDATNVIAPACRTMFVGDDPGTYYSNGLHVGRDSHNVGAFASLFRPGATGLQWDLGNFEHVRSNGDVVLSYRTTDTSGNVSYDTVAARNVNGTLKLSGNGYAYAARVRPFSEHRELINTPDFSYYTTGYDVNIDNKTDSTGNPVFSQVVLTTPTGSTRVYKPASGLSYLVPVDDNGVKTAGSVFRLRGEYQNTATAGDPSSKESSLFFLNPQYSDAQISALNDQSVWKLEFVPVNGTVGNAANVTQSYRTLSRAQTIGEIRQIAFVGLTSAMRSQLVSASSATGNFVFGAPSQNDPNNIDFSADGNLDAWTVPPGTVPPTSFTAYGRAPYGSTTANQPGDRFNDSTGVPSSRRSVVLYCSPQTAGDKHCDSSVGLQYAQGTSVNNFELLAFTSRQLEVTKKIALYKLQ